METRTIKHELTIPATPAEVYQAFLDSDTHARFTEFPAMIEPVEGGFFKTCGERNYGYTLRLVTDERIVQAWTHREFPDLQYSIIDLRLHPAEEGTKIEFHQLAVPLDCYDWLDEGWHETYWKPLRKYFEERNK